MVSAKKYGIPIVNKRISISPIAVAAAPFGPEEMVSVARTLEKAARTVGVDFIGGYSALVEKGMAAGDRALIASLPQALAETERICASINVASTRAGIKHGCCCPNGRTDQGGGRSHSR